VVMMLLKFVVIKPTGVFFISGCNCNTNGTIGLSVTCDATGQCVCKRFVMNLQCDTCQDGYYGLDATKLDGNFTGVLIFD